MRQLVPVCAFAMLILGGANSTLAQEAPRIDVAFLLDATGSMGDEIEAVKTRIRDMISEIALGEPMPDVRFGMVAYRDRGDEYVTRAYELTRDIDRIVANLDQIQATGGGDYPESLNEALHVALQELNWETGDHVTRLVFLIADAPPHLDYADDFDYRDEIQVAAERGIAIHAIGASGLDKEGEEVFREIAEGAGGQFQWLAYQSQFVDQDGEEVIVVVEGRTATYTKGDSTWTVAEGEEAPEGLPRFGKGGADGIMTTAAPELDDGTRTAAEGSAGGSVGEVVSSSTNLGDLITDTIKAAAEEGGVDYAGGGGDETAVAPASWGQVKSLHQGR